MKFKYYKELTKYIQRHGDMYYKVELDTNKHVLLVLSHGEAVQFNIGIYEQSSDNFPGVDFLELSTKEIFDQKTKEVIEFLKN